MPDRSALDEPFLINELIKRRLGSSPHATAVECGTHQLTWRRLDARIRHLACGLRASRMQPGERFAVLAHNHPACLEAMFAAALTGTTAVILDWRLPEDDIVQILQREQVRLLFVGGEFADLLERVRPQLDDLDTVVMVGRPSNDPHGTDDYELWLELHETGEGMYEAAKYRPSVDDAVLQAHPEEGRAHVAFSHRALHREVAAVTPEPGDPHIVTSPLYLLEGVREALHGIRHGSRTVLLRP
ncbi:MAG TPA: class I adenylate-forming enzyme family protein [Actinocrinis sp.]|jgi:acyl-CoA synthetase (AMP-forming)/AMP-acid ligase II|uniref:class I adenylate-forming enzyme family protein n=1 Tax=Actinocrinis sp. TaxID=1920516 RepID=UPI002DDCC51A|nr:class I adenylate-forming enzyme family protein [Actinocrinis sp.]HEV3170178.1 class I adenylate-forming enzyme family protein [Actinocrinis sp.]